MKTSLRIPLTAAALLGWIVFMAMVMGPVRAATADLGWPGFVMAMVLGAVTGFGTVVIFMIGAPQRQCPRCEAALPRNRKPRSWRQALRGGCHCPACGVELDRHGRVPRAAPGWSAGEARG